MSNQAVLARPPGELRYSASAKSLALRFRSKPACRSIQLLDGGTCLVCCCSCKLRSSACSTTVSMTQAHASLLKARTAGREDDAVRVQRRQIRQAQRRHVAALVTRQAFGACRLRQLWVPGNESETLSEHDGSKRAISINVGA